jgi:DMSO/TMAO reductase YedYZ molybdopterin-dependent catalytic subunit
MYLSAQYAEKSDDFTAVLGKKADTWPRLREQHESDKQADRAWDATIEGRLETPLRLELKSLEKLMGAIKTHLRVKETEARNQF